MAVAISELTPQQLATLTQKQKSQQDLPFYYAADLKKDIQISRDFEAYLILSPAELKTSALSWINKAVKLNKPNKLRDELTTISINQELKNSQAKLDAYESVLGDFNKFRKNLESETIFSSVPEVQLFITDLQGTIEELVVGQQRAFFDNTVAKVLQRNQPAREVTQAKLEELQSWTTVISAYLGG